MNSPVVRFKKITEKLFSSIPPELAEKGDVLSEEFRKQGYIRKTPKEILSLDIRCFIPLIDHLLNSSGHKIDSPVSGCQDSSWMASYDMTFMNIRACGPDHEKTGTFLDAVKLLFTLRTKSIHLAPFVECSLGIVYAIQSLTVINDEIIDPAYEKAGFGGEDQLRLFIDIAHLAGKTVGFDLEPHTSQFSRTAIENPSLFRWVRFAPDRKKFDPPLSQEEILNEEIQKIYHIEIRVILNKILEKYRLKSLEEKGRRTDTKKAHYECINCLIDEGFWTVPSHTWKGAGLPEFDYYHPEHHYPVFRYLSWDNEDHKNHAFGVLSPFRFYDGFLLNRIHEKKDQLRINGDVLKYFINIFPSVYRNYPFDFIRFDFVDHIFDSILDHRTPYSDKLTPFIMKRTIKKARSFGKPFIGALAERMGTDIGKYRRSGFDLILGKDVVEKLNFQVVRKMLGFNQKLEKDRKKSGSWSTVQYAVDTHDTDHPTFQYTPMKLYGISGTALKLFLARFACFRRPKYEVIGIQDGTTGLYQANNEPVSLMWKNDPQMFEIYHRIEDLYEKYKPFLAEAVINNITAIKNKLIIWSVESHGKTLWCLVNPTSRPVPVKRMVSDDLPFIHLKGLDPYTGEEFHSLPEHFQEIKPYQSLLFF